MSNYRLELLGKGAANDPNDGLAILTLSSDEEMSKVPVYSIEVLSRDTSIRPSEVLMQVFSVKCEFDDEQGEKHTRYFTGHAVKFSPVPDEEERSSRYFKYRIELRPWLWFLGLRRNCWIFQGKSIQEIIEELLQRYPSAPAVEWRIAPPRKKREYCVQYRESDLNFVSRLLEEEGIHYWFEHSRDKAVLVLGNGTHAVKPLPADDTLIYTVQFGGEQRYNELYGWGYESEVCPDFIRLWDYDFITCEKRERTLKAEIPEHLLEDQESQLDYFDYPAGFVEDGGNPESNPVYLDEQAEIRLAELRGRQEIFAGTSEWPDLAVGYTVEIDNHPNPDLNREVVILSTRWSLVSTAYQSQYTKNESPQTLCHFRAFPLKQWHRPQAVTRKPVIPGSQTAIVVGKENDEIHTDKHGRIKVRFHWDGNGSDNVKDENRSCWVRVAQMWAGNGWGTQFIPRVGQEVVVSFLEGDPDRPLVTGSVYNGRNKPAYEQPANLTQSGIRTKSSPDGGAKDFNELMFEDKKGEEEVYFKAQRRMDLCIGQNFYQSVGGESNITIGGASLMTMEDKHHVFVYDDQYLSILGEANWACVHDVKFHCGQNMNLRATRNFNLLSGGAFSISGGNITLKAGGSFIKLSAGGIEIEGPIVKINCGGSAAAASVPKVKFAEVARVSKCGYISLDQPAPALDVPPPALDVPPLELPPRPVLPLDQGIRSIDTTMRWQCSTLQGIIDQGDAALDAIDDSMTSLDNKLNTLLTNATDMGESAMQQAADLVGKAQVAMNEAKTQIASAQTDVCQALESSAKQFQSLTQNTVKGVCNAADQIAKATNHSAVQSVLGGAGIANQVNQALAAQGAALQDRLSALQSAADQAVDGMLDTAQDAVNAAGNTLGEGLGDVTDALVAGADKLKSEAGNALDKASDATRSALKEAAATASAAKGTAKAALTKAKASVCHAIPAITSILHTVGHEILKIDKATESLLKKEAGIAMDIARQVERATEQAIDYAKDKAKQAEQAVREGAEQLAQQAEKAIDSAKNTAKQAEQAVREEAEQLAQQAEKAIDSAKDTVNDIHNKVKQAEQAVQNRAEQLAQQAEQAVAEAKQQIDKAADQAKQAAASAEQALKKLI